MTTFLKVWFTGYISPSRMIMALKDKAAPQWGIYGQLIRALLDALLLYLPLWLLGNTPSTPSYLTFLPTSQYYGALVLIAPFVLMLQWLFLSATLHTILRLSGRESDIDQIMNITGMAALVVGSFLLVWDWAWIALGLENAVWLGLSHLVLDVWGMVITVLGFRRLLNVPIWLGIVLNMIWVLLGLPIAMIFMRAPV